MKKISICLALVGVLICWSCAITDVDQTADLTQYKTFGWGKSTLQVSNPAYRSDLIDSNIKTCIKEELVGKGISYREKKPDVLVSYEGYTEKKERMYGGGVYYYPSYFPFYSYRFFPYGGYMMGGPMWSSPPYYSTYTEGTLALEMRDRKTGKLLWRGLVQGSVGNVKSLKKNISKGVKAILKKYPAVPPPLIPIPKEKVS